MKRYVLRIKEFPTSNVPLWIADLNGDGSINNTDMLILERVQYFRNKSAEHRAPRFLHRASAYIGSAL